MSRPAPRWDLTNVYPSLESKEFKAAIGSFKTQVSDLEDYFAPEFLSNDQTRGEFLTDISTDPGLITAGQDIAHGTRIPPSYSSPLYPRNG